MKPSHLRQTVAVAALLAAQPALADVTAEDVWVNMQGMITDMGATIEGSTGTGDDGALAVDDITYVFAFPDGSMTGNIDRMTFRELGDGTVEVGVDGAYTLSVEATPEGEEAVTMELDFETPGLRMIASGDPGAIDWNYSADEVIGKLTAMEVDGEPVDARLDIHMGPSTGSYTAAGNDSEVFESRLNTDSLAVDGAFTDPDDAATAVAFSASYSDFSTTSTGNADSMAAMADPEAFFDGDVAMSARYSHAGGSLKMDIKSADEGDMAVAYDTTSGTTTFVLDDEGIDYAAEANGLAVTASGSAIPLPELAAEMEKFQVGLKFPLEKADTATDLRLLLNLGGLTVSEILWSMVDPSAGLPHDPATLFLSITGKMRLTHDLTDEAAMNSPVPPFAFEALDLEGLTLSVAGAELTGEGGFDFAGAPPGTLPGMPGVGGTFNLRLEGANALLEKLVTLGLVPQDMAMTAQMMSGMVARTTGDDVLESEIELGPDGSISANGNRLK